MALYDYESSLFMLGCISNQPSLLSKYPMNKMDFEGKLFHKVVFVAIMNLYNEGATEIDAIIIQQWMDSNYPEKSEVLMDNHIEDFIDNIKDISKVGNVEYYYQKVRKFGILRYYQKLGLDITKIYDESKDEVEQGKKLNEKKVEDIVNYFEGSLMKIKKMYVQSKSIKEMKAGDGFEVLKERWKLTPSFGFSLSSPYLNSVTRGWSKGDLFMYSSGSGGGKTTVISGELTSVCVTALYDKKTNTFIKNKQGVHASLYILTEMDMETQLQPKFISYIADVAYDKILDGKYEGNEEWRVDEATKILQESHIYFVDMPEFTISLLQEYINYYVVNHGIEFVVFDYLSDNNIVGAEISKENGTSTRQDMVLLTLGAKLKKMAEDFHVGIYTMSQLNGKEKINEVVDESCVFGSTAIKNKLDCGLIAIPPRKKELEEVQSLITRHGFGEDNVPNNVMHIYKGRFSKYGQNIKIWRRLDLSTGRAVDLFCTDAYNHYIDIEKIIIEADIEEEPIQ